MEQTIEPVQVTPMETVLDTPTETTEVTPTETTEVTPVEISEVTPTETTEVTPTETTEVTPTETVPVETTPVNPVQPAPSTIVPVVTSASSTRRFVHPFLEMLHGNVSEQGMIDTMAVYMGVTEIGKNADSSPIYDVVDLTEFFGPVTQVFAYCANNGKRQVVNWLMNNYVPLNVSYDNNYCYFESIKWGLNDIAESISQHHSFVPSFETIKSMLSKSQYNLLRSTFTSPHLEGELNTYKYTLQVYLHQKKYAMLGDLIQLIEKRLTDNTIEINYPVYDDNFASASMSQVETPIATSIQPPIEPSTEVLAEPFTEAQTESSTEIQTESSTEAQTEPSAEALAEPSIEAQTEPSAEAQTEPSAEVQTESSTEALVDTPIVVEDE